MIVINNPIVKIHKSEISSTAHMEIMCLAKSGGVHHVGSEHYLLSTENQTIDVKFEPSSDSILNLKVKILVTTANSIEYYESNRFTRHCSNTFDTFSYCISSSRTSPDIEFELADHSTREHSRFRHREKRIQNHCGLQQMKQM